MVDVGQNSPHEMRCEVSAAMLGRVSHPISVCEVLIRLCKLQARSRSVTDGSFHVGVLTNLTDRRGICDTVRASKLPVARGVRGGGYGEPSGTMSKEDGTREQMRQAGSPNMPAAINCTARADLQTRCACYHLRGNTHFVCIA